MNCIDILFQNEQLSRKRPGVIYFDSIKALEDARKNISFLEFGHLIGKAQKKLIDLKVNENDAALLFELPSPGLYAVISAMLGLGIKVLLVEPWLPVSEINHIIEEIKPKIFVRKFTGKLFSFRVSGIRKIPHHFSSDDFISGHSGIKPFSIPVDPNHVGILTFTSGTTGKSKGVARTHRYLIDQRDVISKYIDYQNLEKLDLTVFTNLTLMNLALGKGSLIIPKWTKGILSDLNKLPDAYLPDSTASGPYFLDQLKNHITNEKFVLDTIKVGGALSGVKQMEEIEKKLKPNRFYHVYGSTEAEPVAVSDMRESIKKSKEKDFFQCLYLGKSVPEIKLKNQESLWVSGKHVSPFYLNDEVSNQKNKLQYNGEVYHNMGDRIHIDEDGALYYQGRDFQSKEDFLLEQAAYNVIESSEGFVTIKEGKKLFVTSVKNEESKKLTERFKEIDEVVCVKEILKDRRHMSRLDRHATLKKFKI